MKNSFIYPYFVVEGKNKKESISSFDGVFRFSVDTLLNDISQAKRLGINKILLFGVTDKKDLKGSYAYSPDNIISTAISEIKKRFPRLVVMTDICLCAYTSHGHCGILENRKSKIGPAKFAIDNAATLKALSGIALAHARSGADYVAPSAMAKNQVLAIRKKLDENGFAKVKIMGYSAKFASNFYGPFRNAANSSPAFGDRSGYQLDYSGSGSAIKEIKTDIKEGADIVMVKPALAYLDIIAKAKQKFSAPIAAYNVSGEYAFVMSQPKGAQKNLALEILTAIKRAGADYIITYHAKEAARWLK